MNPYHANKDRPMKSIRLSIVLSIVFAFSANSAIAQFGVYGEYSATHIPTESFFGASAAWYNGFSVGAYDDFLHAGPIGVGFDLRGGYAKANGAGSYSVLVGPRLTIKPPLLPIRPYIQASVGLGGLSLNTGPGINSHTSGRLEYGVLGGLDYTIFPHLDLRLPEIGYLRTHADQFSGPAAPENLLTLSAGVVLRLP